MEGAIMGRRSVSLAAALGAALALAVPPAMAANGPPANASCLGAGSSALAPGQGFGTPGERAAVSHLVKTLPGPSGQTISPVARGGGLMGGVTPGVVRGRPTIDPNGGWVSQALSHRAALDWLHLRLPWWNPYEGTGAPLAAGMQSAALFPPTLLTLLGNGQL